MKESQFLGLDAREWLLIAIIFVVAAGRVLLMAADNMSPWSNFSPVGAMALFGGAYLSNWRKFAFPLVALWVGDLFLSRFVFGGEWVLLYEGALWTYGAIILMVLVGQWLLHNKVKVTNFLGASLLIVFIHWIVTDLGVWLEGSLYPKTLSGFIACLTAALPFERNLLGGTLVYGAILFGAWEWIKVQYTARFSAA